VFKLYSRRYLTSVKRLLILNSYSSYLSIKFNIFYKENTIIYLYIPTYTSYLLQPLNIRVFSPLKRVYRKLLKGIIRANNNYINKKDFLSLYPLARGEVFNAKNIYIGFIGTRLNPINLKQVLIKITF